MDDLISRQAAIEKAETAAELWSNADDFAEGVHAGYLLAANLIKALPSAERRGRWIPVTERLPEELGTYLVTVVDGTIKRAIAQWWYDVDNGEGFFSCDDCYAEDIVAWMPLAEPYKGGEEE